MKSNKSRILSSRKKRNRIIIVTAIVVLLLICGGYFLSRAHIVMNSPEKLFEVKDGNDQTLSNQNQTDLKNDDLIGSDVNESTTANDQSTSNMLIENRVVNILLLGIDQTSDGRKLSGTMAHADAIIVVAINFDTKEVSLVSLPRDSFVNMPSVKGFYKLNGIFNVGGEYSNGGGFESMCAAAQWILGGIPIDYYYSVDFDAIVKLVDALGGIDFDMDMAYQGASGYYNTGMQHLDGDGVLDYMRARKNATAGANDRERTNRQKRMLVAIFNEVKNSDLIKTIPAAISSAKEGFYTNTNIEQTLSLANFARNIPTDSISTYSLYGEYKAGPIQWNWTFIDPSNRIDVIKEVWGITVAPLECTSYEFMEWLRDYGFKAIKFKSNAEIVGKQAEQIVALTTEQQSAFDEYMISLSRFNVSYDIAARSLDYDETQTMINAQEDLRVKATQLAEVIQYEEKLDWSVSSSWCEDIGINEVYVDFR